MSWALLLLLVVGLLAAHLVSRLPVVAPSSWPSWIMIGLPDWLAVSGIL